MGRFASRETRTAIVVGLCAAGLVFAVRVTPHPWNVAPVAAAFLCLGAFYKNRAVLLLPLAGSLAADVVVGFDRWQITSVIYGCYLMTWVIGRGVRGVRRPQDSRTDHVGRLGLGAMAGSVLFFLSTNWAVWMWSGIYPATWAGLGQSYLMAIPFFKHTLAGDLLFTAFFAGLAVVAAGLPAWVHRLQALKEHRV